MKTNRKYKHKRYKIVHKRVRRNVYGSIALFWIGITAWQSSIFLNDISRDYAITEVQAYEHIEEKELSIQDHVWKIMSEEYNLTYKERIRAFDIIACESGWDVYAIGDNGKSHGLWQIYEPAHPQYTRACKFDVYCGTRAAMKIFTTWNNFEAWTCNKLI